MTLQLRPVGRSVLYAILQAEPFEIAREGMRAAIVAVSEGNVGIALIAATLAAQGIEPYELSRAELFSGHVEMRLRGTGAGSRETREVLALISALGGLDLSNPHDLAATTSLLGGDAASLRRRLDELADSGIVVEQPEHLYGPPVPIRPSQTDLFTAYVVGRPRRLWVHFTFAVLPTLRPLTVSWYDVDHHNRRFATLRPNLRARSVATSIALSNGEPLPAGHWRVVLRDGGVPVGALAIQLIR
jgi:hypothetical protein